MKRVRLLLPPVKASQLLKNLKFGLPMSGTSGHNFLPVAKFASRSNTTNNCFSLTFEKNPSIVLASPLPAWLFQGLHQPSDT